MIPATPADLAWWLDLAPRLKWSGAVTYASSAPHWYVVRDKTEGMTQDDFNRVGRIIRSFGEPGKFYSLTNLYLYTADRRLKFWYMWPANPQGHDVDLINLATTDRTYGPQDHFDMERVYQLRFGD